MKNRVINFGVLWAVLLLLSSCEVAPVAIDYQADQCDACKMMIVDPQFGSELVTTKGKIFKYDAIECLVPEVNAKGEEYFAFILVSNFNQPASLIDAKEAIYLVSKSRPSPMGGFLSAYENREAAFAAKEQLGGELYDWTELKKIKRYASRSQ